MVKILKPRNNYFEIADKMYQSCIPFFREFALGKMAERIAIKNLDAISYSICKKQLWQDWLKFLGPYYCMHISKREYENKLNQSSFAPYWRYSCDNRYCNHQHGDYHNLVIRYDDPFWNRYFPPNSWECGCIVYNLTIEQYKNTASKLTTTSNKYFLLNPPYDINFATRDWTDIYKKLFIQHFVSKLFELDNFELNEDDE